MAKIGDIIYMLLGIGLLLAAASGAINLGIWGYLGAIRSTGPSKEAR